ncbi:transglycosylase domain-containing protein [Paracoccus litorisediminis]|uniref:transglycosylase domain-containing protein n=1 Tax=Paracoccus litorisediminis TaxID=2006130 RepID=UPI00373458FB
MADLGLYAISRLVAAFLGTTASLPGGTGLPQQSLVNPVRSGYEITLRGRGAEEYGLAISQTPLAVDLAVLPENFLNAVIAIEDKRFLEHPGLDMHGTLAALKDTALGTPRGGSGLAQQMVKNTMVGPQVTYERKAVEAMLAVRAVQEFGHREVMRRYLQTAWFGRGRTGVMAAPRAWFGKEWREVSLAEAATLAAMLKGPSRYDPYRYPDRVKTRRDQVIMTMLEQGWVTQAEADAAIAEPVNAIAPAHDMPGDAWAAMAARRELDKLGLVGRGTAELTIDPKWQEIAARALGEELRKLSGVVTPPRITLTDLALLEAQEDHEPLPASLRAQLPAGSAYSSFALVGRDKAGWTVVGPAGRITGVALLDPHAGWTPAIGDIVTGSYEPGDPEAINSAADEVLPDMPGRPPRRPLHLSGMMPAGPSLNVRLRTEIEGAIVIIDPRNGELIATVGGVDPNLTWFDRSEAIRPPGSSIKPFLYLAALDLGFNPQSPLQDITRTYRSGGRMWTPKNYDGKTLGVVPMHTAIERSLNVATVWLAARVGIDAMALTAEAAGVYRKGGMVRVLPAALGASDTTLADLTAGYATLANEARPVDRHVIRAVARQDGSAAHLPDHEAGEQIASPGAANDILGMMRGVITRGTAAGAMKSAPVVVAGKTGTSQSHRDAWFVSVTPHAAIGVWIGRDDNKPLPGKTTGGGNAAPVTARILQEAFDVGLITAEGWRDENRARDLPWPPDEHADLPRGKSAPVEDADDASGSVVRVVAEPGDPLGDALQKALNGGRRDLGTLELGEDDGPTRTDSEDDGDVRSESLPPPADYDDSPVDRNGDLLDAE